MRLRRHRPERDVDDLRRRARDSDLGWDVELAEEGGMEAGVAGPEPRWAHPDDDETAADDDAAGDDPAEP